MASAVGNTPDAIQIDNYLKTIYYDPTSPAGFSTAKKLYNHVKHRINKNQVDAWVKSQRAYTLHRDARKKIKRNRYHVTNIDDLFQADLIDLRSLKNENDGFNYLLSVIDVFSKYAWVKLLRTKTGSEVASQFKEIFTKDGRIPINLQTDKGTEFLARDVQKLFKDYKINFYVSENPDVKAAVVERFNKTLKSKIFKYFTYTNKQRYVDVLDDFVKSYNDTVHTTIKMKPSEVTSHNILTVYRNTYANVNRSQHIRKAKYKVGDRVRITKYKIIFEKGYIGNYSEEIFKINKIIQRDPVIYKLVDLLDEPIEGVFYEPELQHVNYSDDSSFIIEKILKKRYKNGKHELFVQWRGYPSKFNSWIDAQNLTEL